MTDTVFNVDVVLINIENIYRKVVQEFAEGLYRKANQRKTNNTY